MHATRLRWCRRGRVGMMHGRAVWVMECLLLLQRCNMTCCPCAWSAVVRVLSGKVLSESHCHKKAVESDLKDRGCLLSCGLS